MAALGDIYEFIYMGRLHGQEIRYVHHYELTAISGAAGAPDADAANAATQGMESFWGNLKNTKSTEFTMYGLMAQRIRPAPRTAGYYRVPAAQTGTVAASALPSSIAVVIRKKTAFAGRAFRGRTYYTGIPSTQETDSQLNAGSATVWEGIGDAMEVSIAPPAVNGRVFTFAPRLYSRKFGTVNAITSCAVDVVLRNQRRRQLGKGV